MINFRVPLTGRYLLDERCPGLSGLAFTPQITSHCGKWRWHFTQHLQLHCYFARRRNLPMYSEAKRLPGDVIATVEIFQSDHCQQCLRHFVELVCALPRRSSCPLGSGCRSNASIFDQFQAQNHLHMLIGSLEEFVCSEAIGNVRHGQ